jgi:DNA primase
LVHRGGRGQSFEYELLFDGAADNAAPHVSGLIEVEALRQAYDVERSGSNAVQSGVGRPAVGGESAGSHLPTDAEKPVETSATAPSARANGQKAPTRSRAPAASYVAAS